MFDELNKILTRILVAITVCSMFMWLLAVLAVVLYILALCGT